MGTNQVFVQRVIPVLFLLFALSIASCSDDTVTPPAKQGSVYRDISADQPRDNVLYNLQKAYNDRNITRYDDLLDVDFVFYFSPEDVLNGTPEYWSRAHEINANKNMFDPNYSNPTQEPVQDLDLVLAYTEGDDQWSQLTPEDQVTYPGETWYQKIVIYNLTVQLPGDFQYVGLNKQAAFVLRAATEDSKQYWRLVVWRDDTGPGLRNVVRHEQGAGIAQDMTWGQIKALYSE